MSISPLASPTYYPSATLTKPKEFPGVFLLELHARPDNRLETEFINDTVVAALMDVEREFRASRAGDLEAEENPQGWSNVKPGEMALVTCGPRDKNRFYSNGLVLEKVAATEGFFQYVLYPMYTRLLTFPIPTVCALNGHAFAGGMVLALSHDMRVMKEGEAKGRAMMCMNELEFGAHIPSGLLSILEIKMPNKEWLRKCVTESHRFGAAESAKIGLVDALAPEAKVVDEALAMALSKAPLAKTGVYGMIKTSIYKESIQILAQHEGFVAASLEDEHRRMKLGERMLERQSFD